MARIDIKVARSTAQPGRIDIHVPWAHIPLTEEEAGELAQQLLSKLGCSFEIKWPQLKPSLDEQVKLRTEALARRREKAEEYVAELQRGLGYEFPDGHRDRLVEAYVAGHDDSPKPLNHPYR